MIPKSKIYNLNFKDGQVYIKSINDDYIYVYEEYTDGRCYHHCWNNNWEFRENELGKFYHYSFDGNGYHYSFDGNGYPIIKDNDTSEVHLSSWDKIKNIIKEWSQKLKYII